MTTEEVAHQYYMLRKKYTDYPDNPAMDWYLAEKEEISPIKWALQSSTNLRVERIVYAERDLRRLAERMAAGQ
jgi:hypothetical protein